VELRRSEIIPFLYKQISEFADDGKIDAGVAGAVISSFLLLEEVLPEKFPCPSITPEEDGEVRLNFFYTSHELELHFTIDGEVLYLTDDGSDVVVHITSEKDFIPILPTLL
jgi:hypothetical protein